MNANTIQSLYYQQFGARPQIVVRAPGRINLIGEHTDYNDGFVLPGAIDRAIWLAAAPREDGRFAFFAPDMNDNFVSDDHETVFQAQKTWANYLLGVISEARRDGMHIGGLNVAFGGDVPLGAGLSSSAALESGMLMVLDRLFGLNLSPMEMVRLAQRGENRFVGMQCGIMDMFASVMGRENQLVRLDCRNLDYAYFPFHGGDYSLVLLDSCVKHQLVDSEYNTRRAECMQGVETLKQHDAAISSLRDVTTDMLDKHRHELPEQIYRRCRFVVDEIARVEAVCAALQQDDLPLVGRLMYAGHEGLNLQYEVCVPETNALVELAKSFPGQQGGAVLGARQMGGGFGGCTLNLVETNAIDAFVDHASTVYRNRFGLDLKAYPVHLSAGVCVVETL